MRISLVFGWGWGWTSNTCAETKMASSPSGRGTTPETVEKGLKSASKGNLIIERIKTELTNIFRVEISWEKKS